MKTSEQAAARKYLALRRGTHPNQVRGRQVRSERFRAQRLAAQADGRLYARAGDPLHAAGCMLYWAEGRKSRNQVRISNADPEVLRTFVRFLRAYFAIPDEVIRLTCNLFADHLERQEEIEQFWLDQLGLTRASLLPSVVNFYSKHTKKKRTNRLPYGTCNVNVNRTAVVQHIFGAIQEYAGFERPEWLDALRSEVPRARS